jgi:hypothetical protein
MFARCVSISAEDRIGEEGVEVIGRRDEGTKGEETNEGTGMDRMISLTGALMHEYYTFVR